MVPKFLLLFVVVFAQQYATTAPNIRPPTEQLREQRGPERVVPYVTVFFRTLVSSWAFLEGSVLFALSSYCPLALARSIRHTLLPASLASHISTATLTTPTPAFVVGTLLSLAGALLRGHCFRTLGQRFTFELSIRPSHMLVTDGIYGIVRHPSYTGAIVVALGWLLCTLDRQGWLVSVCAACVQVHTSSASGGGERGEAIVTAVLACAWATALVILFVAANKRMNKEDDMLEKNFGEEWRAWATRVPWRLFPGIY